jgi:hypothetical protein
MIARFGQKAHFAALGGGLLDLLDLLDLLAPKL